MSNEIYVFGSNLRGFHGAGTALEALVNHGAVPGQAVGRQGRSYAIPTKSADLQPLPLEEIKRYVCFFIKYALQNPTLIFNIQAIGCGYAGYSPREIAPLFKFAPPNCRLPKSWKKYI